jgi:hypothetical protein
MAKTARMQIIVVVLLSITVVNTISITAQDEELPIWNPDWAFQQELSIPIITNNSKTDHQPIDMEVVFKNKCWTRSINESSIRVLSLFRDEWFELDSQIYRLEFDGDEVISRCSIVFLIPVFADGSERYFVFYNDKITDSAQYKDHVAVEELYYSYSPFPEITAEAHYYGVLQDGDIVYGVGQEGQLLDRAFSQIVIKQDPEMDEFDVLNSDQIVSFAFSYYYGGDETDESSTDQRFVDKKVWVDGNLMTEFGIISESLRGDVRTSAVYKYYYSPVEERRMTVRVQHEFLDDALVQGKVNIDGRFGTILSFRSRNSRVKKMNAGTIFPYIHFANDENVVEEYQMNMDPESRQREWIIDYLDDADIGPQGWLAYGDGATGRSRGIIFHSNKDFIRTGTDERDGIQVKIAEREYFDFLGSEVDYASINFGRNSYEKGMAHDLYIPKNLMVVFDAELFAVDEGGYLAVKDEAEIFQELVKHRVVVADTDNDEVVPRYDLMVVSHFGGTRLSYPLLARRLNLPIPLIEIELYQGTQRIRHVVMNRSATVRSYGIFHNVPEGMYLVKIFWRFTDSFRLFNGATVVRLYGNREIHVFCTWQRRIIVDICDQFKHPLSDVEIQVVGMDNFVYSRGRTDSSGKVMLFFPYSRQIDYEVQAMYDGFRVFQQSIPRRLHLIRISGQVSLYNLTVVVRDINGLPPGVSITPLLIPKGVSEVQLFGQELDDGRFLFHRIPSGEYSLIVSYSRFTDVQSVVLTQDSEIEFSFSALFELDIDIFDNRGSVFTDNSLDIIANRGVYQKEGKTNVKMLLPPAVYSIKIYQDDTLIGLQSIELSGDKQVNIITSITPLIPFILTSGMLIVISIAILGFIIKKIDVLLLLKIFIFTFLIVSLMQPWWMLSGEQVSPIITKVSTVYVNPTIMIEEVSWDGMKQLEVAELPELFIDFIDYIGGLIVLAGLCLVGAIVLEWYGRTRYALLLIGLVVLLSVVMSTMFYLGMERLTEVSIGPVIGSGLSSVIVDTVEYQITASWGFGTGFFFVFAAIICGIIILLKYGFDWWSTRRKLQEKRS